MLLKRDLHTALQIWMSRCMDAVIQCIARPGVLTCTDSSFVTVFAGLCYDIFAFCLLQN